MKDFSESSSSRDIGFGSKIKKKIDCLFYIGPFLFGSIDQPCLRSADHDLTSKTKPKIIYLKCSLLHVQGGKVHSFCPLRHGVFLPYLAVALNLSLDKHRLFSSNFFCDWLTDKQKGNCSSAKISVENASVQLHFSCNICKKSSLYMILRFYMLNDLRWIAEKKNNDNLVIPNAYSICI